MEYVVYMLDGQKDIRELALEIGAGRMRLDDEIVRPQHVDHAADLPAHRNALPNRNDLQFGGCFNCQCSQFAAMRKQIARSLGAMPERRRAAPGMRGHPKVRARPAAPGLETQGALDWSQTSRWL